MPKRTEPSKWLTISFRVEVKAALPDGNVEGLVDAYTDVLDDGRDRLKSLGELDRTSCNVTREDK